LQIGRGGLAAPAVGFDVKGELLPLAKAAHAGALDGGYVDEHIRAAHARRVFKWRPLWLQVPLGFSFLISKILTKRA